MAQTKPQQDRPRGLWETLEQLSMAGAKGPWGRQEGWTGPDQEFSNPDRCLGSALMALRSREGPRRVMTAPRVEWLLWLQKASWGRWGAIGTEVQRLAGAAGDLGRGNSKSVHWTALT